ncbi:MAG: cytochrome c biosis protein CcmG, thiol:disulfide interchange protein DsbE [Solirubrobacteraceae bacterium]|jgi:cytochrome c biogenesis protein CcmG/thiol:disulfide interchange protein DsbE|nr:cytochrome c biosis protein CcmG, thiol:disulfide interchange protein DsbE [Solirubrobacteraceae bacterium]
MRGRVLLVAVCLTALAGCGEKDAPPAPARQATALASGPRLVGGGVPAFESQLHALRGTPVVVNQWASWCGPCRYEFPFFRALAQRYRGRVAFLGVDSQDGRGAAQEFLRQNPIPYPSFFDPSVKIARVFKGGFAWPTTAYYSRSGTLLETHSGTYASQAKLEADIRDIALGGRP